MHRSEDMILLHLALIFTVPEIPPFRHPPSLPPPPPLSGLFKQSKPILRAGKLMLEITVRPPSLPPSLPPYSNITYKDSQIRNFHFFPMPSVHS